MGPINLEKIKQVHQEMMRRQAQFEADRERCEWLDDNARPRRSAGMITKSDARINALQAKFGPPAKRPQRAKCKVKAPTSVMRLDFQGKSLTITEWSRET